MVGRRRLEVGVGRLCLGEEEGSEMLVWVPERDKVCFWPKKWAIQPAVPVVIDSTADSVGEMATDEHA